MNASRRHHPLWKDIDRNVNFAYKKSLAHLSDTGDKAETYKSMVDAINNCHVALDVFLKSFDVPCEDKVSRKPSTSVVAREHTVGLSDSGEKQRAGRKRMRRQRTRRHSSNDSRFDLHRAPPLNKSQPSFSNSTVSNTVNNSPLVREHRFEQNDSIHQSLVDGLNSVSLTASEVKSGTEYQLSSHSPVSPESDLGSVSHIDTKRCFVSSSPSFNTKRYRSRSPVLQYSRDSHYRNDSKFSRQSPNRYERSFEPREFRTSYESRYSRKSPRRSRSRSKYESTKHRFSTRRSRSRLSPERRTRRLRSTNMSPVQETIPFGPPPQPPKIFNWERPESGEKLESSSEYPVSSIESSSSNPTEPEPYRNQNNTELTGNDEFMPQTQIPNEQSVLPSNGQTPYHPYQYNEYHGQSFFYPMNPPMQPPRFPPSYNQMGFYPQMPTRYPGVPCTCSCYSNVRA